MRAFGRIGKHYASDQGGVIRRRGRDGSPYAPCVVDQLTQTAALASPCLGSLLQESRPVQHDDDRRLWRVLLGGNRREQNFLAVRRDVPVEAVRTAGARVLGVLNRPGEGRDRNAGCERRRIA